MKLKELTTPAKPFKVCYEAKGINTTVVGPYVPVIDHVLQDVNMVWRIFGVASNKIVLSFMVQQI